MRTIMCALFVAAAINRKREHNFKCVMYYC